MNESAAEARAERRRHRLAASTWPGPVPRSIRFSDLIRCPTHRMDLHHFRSDGTCMCIPPRDEALEPHIIRGEN